VQPRPEIAPLLPYEPGKPASALRRELGLERVVKLASNEGPFGPFPAALEAIATAAPGLNRYPEGAAELLEALGARSGSRRETAPTVSSRTSPWRTCAPGTRC
jgi:histidinol-phosphate aminotransferase